MFYFTVSLLLILLIYYRITGGENNIVSQNTSTYQRGVIIITGSLSFGSGLKKKVLGTRYIQLCCNLLSVSSCSVSGHSLQLVSPQREVLDQVYCREPQKSQVLSE